MTPYAPLWCKSNFSFLEGASHPEELVETRAALGLAALALTDRDGVYGVVEAHVKARELGVRLIVGAEVTVDDGSTLVLLAHGPRGLRATCAASITLGRLRSREGRRAASAGARSATHAAGLARAVGRRAQPARRRSRSGRRGRTSCARRSAIGSTRCVARHRRAEEPRREARLRAARGALRPAGRRGGTRCSTTRRRGARCRTCSPASATA